MLEKLKNIKVVLIAWRKIFLDFVFRDIIKYNNELIKRANDAEEKVESLKLQIQRLEKEYAFELNAEMNTKVRVWLKTNGHQKNQIAEINSMTNIALKQIPKKRYSNGEESFDRDYRDLPEDHDGLSKSISK